jgi:CBS domain containing-hemolysin-like protein
LVAPVEAEPLGIATIAWRLVVIFLLVAANGFFVAAEFALVGARRTRIEALMRSGSRAAKFANHAIHHLDHYISGTQLGITLSSLALGWIGETTLAAVFMQAFGGLPEPWNVAASHVVAGTIAFAFITFLHIVLGELAPKSIALLFPEATSMALAAPLIVFSKVFRPFIKILNGTANLLLRAIGLSAPSENERVHRPEEIEMIAMQAYEHGGLGEEPLDMIRGVFDLSERTVADVMVPRTSMVAVSTDATVEDVVELIEEKGFVRIPVYHDSLDDIKGIVLAREVWRSYRRAEKTLDDLIHPVLFVPTTKDLESLLKQMLPHKFHVAIGVDEFGGTAGLVTIEDIIEEIVGEIQDEHEAPNPTMELKGDEIHAAGTVSLFELNDNFGLELPAHEFATIAGYAMDLLGRIAQVDDEIDFRDGKLRIAAMSGRRIERIVITLNRPIIPEETE